MPIQAFILDRRAQLAELCRRAAVRRLALFGSAVRDDFSPHASDLDFLVELEPAVPAVYAERYLVLKEGLEALFDRPVDLLTPAALRNPYLRARVDAESQTVYAG